MAASYLQDHNANFVWLESGGDESHKLDDYSANNPLSMPTQNWMPTNLVTNTGRSIPYQIPKTTGGMSAHYKGNQYWTMTDTVHSLQINKNEMKALNYVRNITNTQVFCDEFDHRYHTHSRSPSDPAPYLQMTSFPTCMYGKCKDNAKCKLNSLYAGDIGLSPLSDFEGWFRQSSFVEYWHRDNKTIPVRTNSEVESLEMNGTRAVGVHVKTGSSTSFICARKSVILAGGVMGNSHILPISSYSFFAQPVVVYMNSNIASKQESCDPNTISGGTVHKQGQTGFMSTLAICKVNQKNRIIWATPQAVNPNVKGRITRFNNGTVKAELNLDDATILNQLNRDFSDTFMHIFNVNVSLSSSFQYAAYHWTGDSENVKHSRLRGFDNIYIGDAMGVTGITSGWTSFNARVAGALAAMRSLERDEKPCSTLKRYFKQEECCDKINTKPYCKELRHDYKQENCCLKSK